MMALAMFQCAPARLPMRCTIRESQAYQTGRGRGAMRLHLVTGLLTLFVCALRADASQTNAPGCDAMVGVWQYVEPSAPGHAIIARQGSKYLGIFVHPLSEPYNDAKPERERRARPTHTP